MTVAHTTVLGILAVGVAAVSGGAGASPVAMRSEGVSAVRYSPKPFYDDLSSISVSFKTSKPVAAGWSYYVAVLVSARQSTDLTECSILEASKYRIVGGSSKTVRIRLYAARALGERSVPALRISSSAVGVGPRATPACA